MEPRKTISKKRALAVPTLDEFHRNLQTLFSSDDGSYLQFTEGAVTGLRQSYWTYLQQVATNLAHYDSLDDLEVVAQSLNINSGMAGIVAHAQDLVAQNKANNKKRISKGQITTHTKRKVKKQKITADMEAEQERLFQQSKKSVLQQQTCTPGTAASTNPGGSPTPKSKEE
ncbi:hypothetical protein IV203_022014 [Nitzschia inconspicua]|uniref:Uncharacterized protein n=1 Tax=Nitzschia inconspicua TaxID=303405 RepID=A0A9K3PEN5_9STRA|nr:hypothetical protein IV203_022014 [Nitzschia inconspicua]